MIGKDLISIESLESPDLQTLLQVARYLKRRRSLGIPETALAGRTLAMIFEKPSLRTRVSFEVGMSELGGRGLYISKDEIGLGKREAVQDVARVLARYTQGIMARVFAHQTVVDLARHASVPVINALSDHEHPCQALGDLLTIQEHRGQLAGLRLAFIGEGNNVARSLAHACRRTGMEFILACPAGYGFTAADQAAFGSAWQQQVRQVHDLGVAGVDVLYTDVWTSMGQEAEAQTRKAAFANYQINDKLLAASPKALVMHCLPAHRGEEITDAALECGQSVIFDQAENRLHAQKGVLRLLMGSDRESLLAAAAGE